MPIVENRQQVCNRRDHHRAVLYTYFLSRLAELPEARARKIVEIRNAIQNETYDTPEKLEIAVERILGAL